MTRAGISVHRRRARSRRCARSATSTRCARSSTASASRRRRRRRRRSPRGPPRIGIGHTRWATHGRVSEENAHPHFDSADRVHVVVNGIVENYMALKERLRGAGQRVHLRDRRRGDRAPDRRRTTTATWPRPCAPPTRELEGHYAFVAMSLDEPEVLVGARKECPLVVGRGEGEQFIASAVPAFLAHTRRVQYRGERRDRRAAPRRRRRSRPPPASAVERAGRDGRLGRGHRREGRLRDVHAQGDPRTGRRASPRRSPTAPRAATASTSTSEGALDEAILADVERDRDRRLRHLLPRRPDRPLRDRGVGAAAGRDRHRLRVPLPQPGRRARATS